MAVVASHPSELSGGAGILLLMLILMVITGVRGRAVLVAPDGGARGGRDEGAGVDEGRGAGVGGRGGGGRGGSWQTAPCGACIHLYLILFSGGVAMTTMMGVRNPPPTRRDGGGGWWRLMDHNPFYLVSVVLMLVGVYLLAGSIGPAPGDMWQLWVLVGVLNLYEGLVIALGAVLVGRPWVPRDGRTLLGLETLFLVEAAFLNAETIMTSLPQGAVLNVVLMVLAAAKLMAMLRALRLDVGRGKLAFLVGQIVLLYLAPIVVRLMAPDGNVPEAGMYAMWWVVGLTPAGFEVLARWWPAGVMTRGRAGGAAVAGAGEGVVTGGSEGTHNEHGQRGPCPTGRGTRDMAAVLRAGVVRVYGMVPFLALVAQLGFLHWVFHVQFYMAKVTPVLLGLALVAGQAEGLGWLRRADVRTVRLVLPVLALGLSLGNPPELAFHVGAVGRAIGPVAVAGLAAYLAYAYCFAFRYIAWFAGVAVLAVAAGLFGPSVEHTVRFADAGVEGTWRAGGSAVTWGLGMVRRIVPRTGVGWGIVATAGSFVFLGMGWVLSLRKGRGVREGAGAESATAMRREGRHTSAGK